MNPDDDCIVRAARLVSLGLTLEEACRVLDIPNDKIIGSEKSKSEFLENVEAFKGMLVDKIIHSLEAEQNLKTKRKNLSGTSFAFALLMSVWISSALTSEIWDMATKPAIRFWLPVSYEVALIPIIYLAYKSEK